MDEKQIIELYWARSEDAIRETDRKYGAFCHGIAFHILGSHPDSEECVNDTYLRVWNAIPPKRPEKFSAFLAKITRNLALNRYEKLVAKKRGGGQVLLALEELSECVGTGSAEQVLEEKLLGMALNDFLASLPGESRRIFLQRYWYLSPVKEIAANCGLSESKVKMSLHRTRGKLKVYLEREGVVL